MRIFAAKEHNENFLDIVLTKKELKKLQELQILSDYALINDEFINLGIRLEIEGEFDAT